MFIWYLFSTHVLSCLTKQLFVVSTSVTDDDVTIIDNDNPVFTNTWAVNIKGGDRIARSVAKQHDFNFDGPIGSLKDMYIFSHKRVDRRSRRSADDHHSLLENHPHVTWAEQQKVLSRKKRGYFSDPDWRLQWYLKNEGQTEKQCAPYKGFEKLDIDVFPAWNRNVTGRGVVVSILDDGLEYTHPDLKKNYDKHASYDFNNGDNDPFPRYTADNINKHGTRCAGEVAAEINNGICGVGVAFNAKVGGIRMLDGDVTDAVEAGSLSYRPDYIDIYSSSWGPDDDGKTVDGPGRLAKNAFQDGILNGRKGRGSIFVWATGNGGRSRDYCSCDGYINAPYTISIGAVDNCGRKPWYAEPCPSTLAVTYSSGEPTGNRDKQIVTTDLHHKCTHQHTGTSAAAPLAAGIFALVLEANKLLTWRDMQHLVVKTSRVVSPDDPDWQTNGAGYKVNIKFGFGALSAANLVRMASLKTWKTALPQHVCKTEVNKANMPLKFNGGTITSSITTNGCRQSASTCINKLEHVHAIVHIEKHMNRGSLEIVLISPSGTRSDLLRQRPSDMTKSEGFKNWAFLTVFHWGENPNGKWTLQVKDSSSTTGKLIKWSLHFYGTCDIDALGIKVNENLICNKECKRNCPKRFSEVCAGCSKYCDCTIGQCVVDCGDLIADTQLRHCRRSNEPINYDIIPNSGKAKKDRKSLMGISFSATFAIICFSLVAISMIIGGIAYLAAKMPSNKDIRGYQSVSRYPCSEFIADDTCELGDTATPLKSFEVKS